MSRDEFSRRVGPIFNQQTKRAMESQPPETPTIKRDREEIELEKEKSKFVIKFILREIGSGGEIRTPDLRIMKPLL
jgi:hypothetical protein